MTKITFLRSLTSAILFNFLVWATYVKDIFLFEIILYVFISLSFIGLCFPELYNIKQTIPSRITGYLSTLLALYLSYNNGGETFAYVLVFWYILYVSILIHTKSKMKPEVRTTLFYILELVLCFIFWFVITFFAIWVLQSMELIQ